MTVPQRPRDRSIEDLHLRGDQVFVGPRFSVNNELRRFAPRDPGQPLDGIGQFLYPARFSTPPAPRARSHRTRAPGSGGDAHIAALIGR